MIDCASPLTGPVASGSREASLFKVPAAAGLLIQQSVEKQQGSPQLQSASFHRGLDLPCPKQHIAIVTLPQAGHLFAPLALAQTLLSRGQDVTFMSLTLGPDGPRAFPRGHVEAAGVEFTPLGESHVDQDRINRVNRAGAHTALANLPRMLNMLVAADVQMALAADDLFAALAARDRLPSVLVTDFTMAVTGTWLGAKYGLPVVRNVPSPNPHIPPDWPHPALGSRLGVPMTFPQRLKNHGARSLFNTVIAGYVKYWVLPRVIAAANATARMTTLPATYAAVPLTQRRVAYVINSAPGVDFPVATPPSAIYTGPLIPPEKAVPAPLRNWLDGKAPGSVVCISMGTTAVLSNETAAALTAGLLQAGVSC
ncbi:hypothetical protein KFL_000100060 [Klebsormidium nitens]|uniref:Uncharacterized protein n=1 Tax=Klebsormidium nitens TaxID=105231 RepID=A0A1Y1HM30_KLENI|nr:hypothetical protein KFL_000100060 [Klebsormidium nitens]|eukprot:GAQ78239.1 hypothetical protein KFL_000100060 [Klebsormidium nitens]